MKVSATQMAKVIGVSRRTIVTWCNRGLLSPDAQLIGGRWVIDWHDFLFDGSPVAHWLNPEYAKVQPKRSGRPKGSKDFAQRVRVVKKKYKPGEKRRLECREKLSGYKFLCDPGGGI